MIVNSKLKKSIAMLAAVTLLTTGVTYAAMKQETTLTVTTDNQVQEVSTQAATVGALLEEMGYRTSNRTVLSVPADAELNDDMQLVVQTKDTVELNIRGLEHDIHTTASTVGEFLREQGLALGEHDVVFPADDTPIHDRIAVTIDTVEHLESVKNEEIAFDTEYRSTDDLYEGESRVTQEGQAGSKQIITRSVRHNGRELPATVTEVVTKEPVTHIVEEGSRVYVAPAPEPVQTASETTQSYTESYSEPATESSSGYSAGGWMNFTATAYDPTVGDTTRMGTPARVGVIAVDPNVIPLGSTVEVEGYGIYSAEDTGGAIKGNKIDIFLSTHSEAINFGVRSVRVRVLN